MDGCLGLGVKGRLEVMAKKCGVSFWVDTNILNLIVMMGCTTLVNY